jgi:hypothetical protein
MTLADRISYQLKLEERPMTSRELASALHVRHERVLHELRSNDSFYLWPHDRKRLYGVKAPTRPDAASLPSAASGHPYFFKEVA